MLLYNAAAAVHTVRNAPASLAQQCDPNKSQNIGVEMAKKAAKKAAKKTAQKRTRIVYTRADVRDLRAHSKARTPLKKIVKVMKRSEGSLRQKAMALGIGLGHRR